MFTERELPFAHVGFGQDAEWVAASFTNATEILAMGYTQWVDAQVGSGLENGLYKLTATLAEDPPETTWLTVGDYSVAVTNDGEYAFLLEKGVEDHYGVRYAMPMWKRVKHNSSVKCKKSFSRQVLPLLHKMARLYIDNSTICRRIAPFGRVKILALRSF